MAIWPWALGRKSISPRISRFSSDCFERIALRRQCRQPLVRIKEPNCPILASANLDILVTLVETYEERRWPLRSRRRFGPVDMLRHAIEELGHSQAELADILGSRSRASEVLARRRRLTLEMIQKIHASWKIPANLLVQPYRIDATAA